METRQQSIFRRESGAIRSGWRLAGFLLALFAVTFVLLLLLRAVGLDPQRPGESAIEPIAEFVFTLVGLAAFFFVLARFLRHVEGRGLATTGLSLRRSAWPELGWGVLIGTAPVVLSVAILAPLGIATVTPSADSLAARVSPQAWMGYTVTTLGSAYEELLMRGYVLQLLVEGAGAWVGALVTGLLWAAGHIGNPGSNAAGIVFTGMSGVLLGWIVIRTGSLWFAIAYHVAWNVVAAHVLGLTTSGFDLGASIFTTKLAGPELLTGGSYGFEGSILTELLDLAGLSTALLLARRWPRDERSAPHYARAIASAAPPPPEAGQDLAAPSPPAPPPATPPAP
jgi:membrane protease YdiL (CAAX protease family)